MPTGTSERRRRPAAQATRETAAPAGRAAAAQPEQAHHELTVTIPLDRITGMITTPVGQAGRVLTSQGGLPLYVGLGVLAAVDVITWPIAVAAGLGYALLRRRRSLGHGLVSLEQLLHAQRAREQEPSGETRPAAPRTGTAPSGASRTGTSRTGAARTGTSRPARTRSGSSKAGTSRARAGTGGTAAGRTTSARSGSGRTGQSGASGPGSGRTGTGAG